MQSTSKFETFVGFSVRSAKIIYGIDKIEVSKKRPKLILICNTLGENTRSKVKLYATSNNVKVLELTTKKLEDVVHKTNCKIVGLTDTHLAEAVIDNSQDWATTPEGWCING